MKIVKHFKRADFARRTVYNSIIRIAYCSSIKGKKKRDRRRLLAPTRKHNLRRLANSQIKRKTPNYDKKKLKVRAKNSLVDLID